MAKKVDWERARRLYRIGQLTDAEIAAVVGCQPGTVSNRASREGWVRDLSTQVAEETRAALTHGEGSDADAVADAAEAAVGIVRAHREHIETARALIYQLFAEMGQVNAAPKMIEDALMKGLAGQDVDIDAIVSAYSLPTRSKSMQSLSTALTRLIQAERQAWNLDEQKSEKPYERLLREIVEDDAEGDS